MRPDPVPQPVEALHRAVHAGDDTDMVAAIAGSLLGARWGAGAIPAEWRALRTTGPACSTACGVALTAQQTRDTLANRRGHRQAI